MESNSSDILDAMNETSRLKHENKMLKAQVDKLISLHDQKDVLVEQILALVTGINSMIGEGDE